MTQGKDLVIGAKRAIERNKRAYLFSSIFAKHLHISNKSVSRQQKSLALTSPGFFVIHKTNLVRLAEAV
ncbi:MAG: hypothetical protein RL641_947 [Candidatus Parcubacteria bacterium]|jgi:hypothetical protein